MSLARFPRGGAFAAGALAFCALAPDARAQFGNEWVSFHEETHRIDDIVPVSDINNEVDFHWGDLDQNGWTDLVVVRKQPFTSTGKRINLLFMNHDGVLVNATQTLAVSSSVGGDQGFLTPTNDRDVVLTDVDQDGWLDVVTAPTLSDGDPKSIGHPRIYMNLGDDGQGNWLGLHYDEPRFPQLFSYSSGLPENPRFCSVAAGDVTGDGYPDLYFGDYDSGGPQGNKDLNDRLLINDGNGFFTDQSQTTMTSEMLVSAFGTAVEIEDMNLDGVKDIVKDTALSFPTRVSVSYNDPDVQGTFNIFDPFHNHAPYHIDVGDLNNDGRPDVIVSDDGKDSYRLNTGNDALGRVVWGPTTNYVFLAGNDDGFASNNLVVDLDNDGWNDAVYCDVDVDIGGYNRRIHFYHNIGDTPGGPVTLVEEREQPSGGWLGVKGLVQSDLTGGHDAAVFDIDNDGDKDMILGRKDGTFAWMNELDPVTCQTDLGFQGPGTATLSMCGSPLWTGLASELKVENAPPGALTFLAIGDTQSAIPIFGGTIVPFPTAAVVNLVTDGAGSLSVTVDGGGGPATLYMQALVLDLAQPELFQFTNAIEVELF